jgi:hypothetical protein
VAVLCVLHLPLAGGPWCTVIPDNSCAYRSITVACCREGTHIPHPNLCWVPLAADLAIRMCVMDEAGATCLFTRNVLAALSSNGGLGTPCEGVFQSCNATLALGATMSPCHCRYVQAGCHPLHC